MAHAALSRSSVTAVWHTLGQYVKIVGPDAAPPGYRGAPLAVARLAVAAAILCCASLVWAGSSQAAAQGGQKPANQALPASTSCEVLSVDCVLTHPWWPGIIGLTQFLVVVVGVWAVSTTIDAVRHAEAPRWTTSNAGDYFPVGSTKPESVYQYIELRNDRAKLYNEAVRHGAGPAFETRACFHPEAGNEKVPAAAADLPLHLVSDADGTSPRIVRPEKALWVLLEWNRGIGMHGYVWVHSRSRFGFSVEKKIPVRTATYAGKPAIVVPFDRWTPANVVTRDFGSPEELEADG